MVLILGASGQLGQEFSKLLEREKVDHRCWTREDLDMGQVESIQKKFKGEKFRVIINCTAYNDVDRAQEERDLCYRLNTYGPRELAHVARKMGAVLIHFSTGFIFDGNRMVPYLEDTEPNPLGEYGASKALGERLVMETWGESLVLRTSWLYGKNGNNFVKNLLKWSKKSKVLRVVDDQVATPTSAKDLAKYTWKLYNKEVYGIYNLTNGGGVSKYNFARYILEAVGWEGEVIPCKSHEFKGLCERPKYSVLSLEKVERILGERIPSWEKAVEEFLNDK